MTLVLLAMFCTGFLGVLSIMADYPPQGTVGHLVWPLEVDTALARVNLTWQLPHDPTDNPFDADIGLGVTKLAEPTLEDELWEMRAYDKVVS